MLLVWGPVGATANSSGVGCLTMCATVWLKKVICGKNRFNVSWQGAFNLEETGILF